MITMEGHPSKPLVQAWRLLPGKSGELESQPLPPESLTLEQATLALPAGAYTTLRTYQRKKALRLEEHFRRLESSARLAGHAVQLERASLRLALRKAIQSYPVSGELRLRLVLAFAPSPYPLYILAERLRLPPPQAYRWGVRAVTCSLKRPLPEAKLTTFSEQAEALRRELPAAVNEALLLDEQGRILEGLSSNFFAVRQGVVFTAGQGMLEGVTRALVLQVIHCLGIPLRLEAVSLAALPQLAEAFLTSASRGVLPLRQIDQVAIGAARPGELTRRIAQGFKDQLSKEVELI